MNKITENLKKYDKDFVKNALWHTKITRPARNYIVFSKDVDSEEIMVGGIRYED